MDINDLQSRLDRIIQNRGDELDDAPDELLPQPVPQSDDLRERLAYIMLLNQLDDADRSEKE